MLVAIALIDAGLEPLDAVERVRSKRYDTVCFAGFAVSVAACRPLCFYSRLCL